MLYIEQKDGFASFLLLGGYDYSSNPGMPPLKISKKHHKHINNPFPSSSNSLPFVHGSLSSNPIALPQHQIFSLGKDFQLNWSSIYGGYLSISHKSQPSKSVWSTIPGEAFVSAAIIQTEVEESRGSFVVRDGDVFALCAHQFIEDIRILFPEDEEFSSGFFNSCQKNGFCEQLQDLQFPVCLITGLVSSKKAAGKKPISANVRGRARRSQYARYWVLIEQKNSSQIGFQVKFGELHEKRAKRAFPRAFKRLKNPKWKLFLPRWRSRWLSSPRGFISLSSDDERGEEEEDEEGKVGEFRLFNRILLTYSSEGDEKFYGFGEQFSHMEFKGKRVPIMVQEQGIGRGDQPITFAANLVSYRSGGDWSTTYAPSPFYMTSKMRSLYLEGFEYSVFDLTQPDKVQIQIHGPSAQFRILYGNSPTELIERFTESIGRPPKLPNWIISGAVVGMQGGTETVRRIWDQLQDYDVPVSAFWLQDWVGQRETIIGSQLWWNWEVDNSHYSGWQRLVNDLRACDIRVMAYCNPCLVQTDNKPNKNRNLFKEATSLGILVKDKSGETYMVPNTTFDVGMLDFTHPSACTWFKGILQEMVDCGIRGWMADFGEGLPLDANLFSGEDPISAHNRYPELWARVNREFVDEWKLNCQGKEWEDPEESLVFFMRAGFRDSPKWAMLFWEGDQMVSWQTNDGIKSSVVGFLSSGLSGFPLNHSDIGGYCSVNLPFMKYQRSEELLLRWMELNAFSTIFRTHEGNNPSSNCQFYSNSKTLAQFARLAKVFKAWEFYRIQLLKEASEKGLPVTRHLFLHYPDDEYVHNLTYQQFLVGTEILVVPVLDKGHKDVKAYFPLRGGCSWQHIWTGEVFSKPDQQGFEAWVKAPIGYPAVFVKFGSLVGYTFLKNLRDLSIL